MNPLKKLFKQTAIYGLATVVPRLLNVILVPVYTSAMKPEFYGELSIIFSWVAILNVLLAYGMETAFFRFFSKSENKETVVSTSLISILVSSILFVGIGFIYQNSLADLLNIDPKYINYVLCILGLDALVIIPFAWLRANEKPTRYSIVKIVNVAINLGLTIFFLLALPKLAASSSERIFSGIYRTDFQISYILIANLVASGITLLLMISLYTKSSYTFDKGLWKTMLKYASPVLIAGVAYTINEVFGRIMLEDILTDIFDEEYAKSEVGKYAACIKLALFMNLFATAFRMGVEPFFFSHSDSENPQKTYAQITNYFVILGSVIMLAVVVFADILKRIFIPNSEYWEAMNVVPLLLLASFFLGIYHNLSVWYKVSDKTRFGAFISIIGAVLTIGINYLFIPKIGYMASAIATLFAYGIMMFLSYYFGKSRYPVPYNFRKILFYMGISILFSAIAFYGFGRSLYAGIPLLLIFLGIVYKLENDKLRQIFTKSKT
ncbi:polysaccharide biosynthesis protein [Maribacter algarum]|uniref:Polysaccharide biosynthesis protein n=1 Tax=Maribacter algarum (ex Zhang et al. 2020) TaxID=2578118 RepID=A0A5S3QLY3_9FLAO|nr:polysaccharide biosynthesis C-terminal domain-containing protein [Maribacter algarum]TMM58904.1 polysaccharide biosynthesis protein [Maribacter algarum]